MRKSIDQVCYCDVGQKDIAVFVFLFSCCYPYDSGPVVLSRIDL